MKKQIATTLIELLVGIIIGSIIIGVGAASIITILRLQYGTQVGEAASGKMGEWVSANAMLAERMRNSAFPYIPSGGRLELYAYKEIPEIPRWVFEDTASGLKLTDTNETSSIDDDKVQIFNGVRVTFEYEAKDLSNTNLRRFAALRAGIRANFTSPRTATVRYMTGRVIPSRVFTGIFRRLANGFWKDLKFKNVFSAGHNVGITGSTDDKTDGRGRSGLLVMVDRDNPRKGKTFTYNWVRGQVFNEGTWTGYSWDVDLWALIPSIADPDKSYIAGVAYAQDIGSIINDGGVTDKTYYKPFPFVAQVNIDTTKTGSALGNGSIVAMKAFSFDCHYPSPDVGDINITQNTMDSNASFISSVQENTDGTLFCAGQVNEFTGSTYVTRVVVFPSVDIVTTNEKKYNKYNFGASNGIGTKGDYGAQPATAYRIGDNDYMLVFHSSNQNGITLARENNSINSPSFISTILPVPLGGLIKFVGGALKTGALNKFILYTSEECGPPSFFVRTGQRVIDYAAYTAKEVVYGISSSLNWEATNYYLEEYLGDPTALIGHKTRVIAAAVGNAPDGKKAIFSTRMHGKDNVGGNFNITFTKSNATFPEESTFWGDNSQLITLAYKGTTDWLLQSGDATYPYDPETDFSGTPGGADSPLGLATVDFGDDASKPSTDVTAKFNAEYSSETQSLTRSVENYTIVDGETYVETGT